MRTLLLFLLLASPLAAETVWTLRTGPDAVPSIPLVPVQPVPAWNGSYSDGSELVWVYVTRSPYFFPPRTPEVTAISRTPWTAVMFFPEAWKAAQRLTWLQAWVADFQNLASLPNPGAIVVFPAVLRKD